MNVRIRLIATAVLAVTAAIAASSALAQEAALVTARDSPARMPYVSDAGFNPGAANCPNQSDCMVQLAAVAPGFRLVVTHAAAEWTNGVASVEAAFVHNSNYLFSDSVMIPPGVLLSGRNRILTSGQVSFYVDGPAMPAMPAIRMNGNNIITSNSAFATLVGYLVPLP